MKRLWIDIGCLKNRFTDNSCSQSRAARQPSIGIGGSACRTELCCSWTAGVRYESILTLTLPLTFARKLSEALPRVEALRKQMKQWPPVVGTNEKTPRLALAQVMDDELGYD